VFAHRTTAPRAVAAARRDNPLLHSPDQGGRSVAGAIRLIN